MLFSRFRALFALFVLVVTAIGLVQFALLLTAGDALRSAGRAAVREAGMPAATCGSIAAAAQRRLATARLADVAGPIRAGVRAAAGR